MLERESRDGTSCSEDNLNNIHEETTFNVINLMEMLIASYTKILILLWAHQKNM